MGNAELATGPVEPTPTPWSFGLSDRLAKALTVAHVSNAEMAQALDVSRNTITNYTSGRTKPSRLQLREWAVRTGAPLEWLETGTLKEVGPGSLDLPTSTVESGRLAPVIDITSRKAS